MRKKPHVLVIPMPAQGHVAPLMKLALKIASHGIKVTFVTTNTTHDKLMNSLQDKTLLSNIHIVPVPDVESPPESEENDQKKDSTAAADSAEFTHIIGPGRLKGLIEEINESSPDERISCVVVDMTLGWPLELAKEMGILAVGAALPGPGYVPLSLQIPDLVEAGVLDGEGNSITGELISVSSDIPPWKPCDLPWITDDPLNTKILFNLSCIASKRVESSTVVLINAFPELAPSAFNLIPKVLPIGPLLPIGPFSGSFWPEDETCMSWLDTQASGSVVYVSFGSTKTLSPQQFQELALGLELSGRPFLWVVRADLVSGGAEPEPAGRLTTSKLGQLERAKVVEWAPQERVLAHPSVACFLSHCGWNSAMEGITMGVPFLCWPYFIDQFHNRNYICDTWSNGLSLDTDENGIISRHEISTKINTLLSSDMIKENCLHLKEAARVSIGEGGSSFENFQRFVDMIKLAVC